jgi:predicted ester cyclase
VSDAAEFVRRLEDAWASFDHDTVRQLWASDMVEHTHHTGGGNGLDVAIQNNEGVRTAFPDCRRTIEDIFADGDKVVARVRMQATNEGGLPWFGIPANGNRVDVEWISEYRVADGKVVEHWTQMDVAKLMQQLGAIPAPGA